MKNLLNYFRRLIFEFPAEYWVYVNQYWDAKMDKKRVRRAIILARAKTQSDRKHRYVIRDMKGRPLAVTTNGIEHLKKIGRISKSINCLSIYNHAIEIVKYQKGVTHKEGSGKKVKE